MAPNILVLRGGALGDFIVTLPALAALRQQWPDATLTFVGHAAAAELGRRQGLIDHICSQHESRWSALYKAAVLPDELRRWLATFDVAVNFWPDPDGELQRHFPLGAAQRFVTAPAMPVLAPAAARYCAALRPLGIDASECFFRFNLGTQNAAALPNPGPTAIAVHPGSGSHRKNWPAERWIELVESLDTPVVFVLGEAEAEAWSSAWLRRTQLARRIQAGSVRVAANLPLPDLADQLSSCRVFLGHDSGVSHLAAACGVPCVLLFGPTDPAMWAPPAPHVRVIRHGNDLAAISIDDVRAAISGGAAPYFRSRASK